MGNGVACAKCTDTRLTCRSCFDFHMKAMADRIAKLEAAMLDSCTQCGNTKPCAQHSNETMLAALRSKLAEPKSLDELMPSRNWTERPEHDEACATRVGTSRNCDCKPPTFDQLVARVGPLASTGMASAESPPAAAGPIPTGYKLAPGWELRVTGAASCWCGAIASYFSCRLFACAAHAVEMGALVKVEPPAPALGAPAEPLGARLRGFAPWMGATLAMTRAWLNARADDVAALEARLADAERERDDAVAAERERCLAHAETYEPQREVPSDWTYQGALAYLAACIRDGRPAPKWTRRG